ncbi:MAG: HlyD family efflux transporter periplasmic adaptor subunit, partial [Cylindrospermopsis raciborskii PAMP2012]
NLLEEKQQAIKSARAKLESAKNNAQSLWDDKQQAFKIAQTNLYKARTAMNPSNSAVIIASQRIKQEQARGEMTIAALNKELGNLLQQRLEIEKQLTRYRQDLLQTEINLQKTVIRAPITGTLLQLKLRNIGQVVQSGQAIAQIAPLNVPLEIKAYIPSQEINKVQVGRKFQMRVSACPYPDYGTLRGRVKNISPDVLSSNITNTTGINGYEVTMEPETLYLGKGENKCYLQPGMEGGTDIISREENVMQFILRKARLISN